MPEDIVIPKKIAEYVRPATESTIPAGTQPILQVTVKNPQSLVFQGPAAAISSFNEQGPLDILPFHANFISLIKKEIIVYETRQKPLNIPIDQGIIKVFENIVDIFIGMQTIS